MSTVKKICDGTKERNFYGMSSTSNKALSAKNNELILLNELIINLKKTVNEIDYLRKKDFESEYSGHTKAHTTINPTLP